MKCSIINDELNEAFINKLVGFMKNFEIKNKKEELICLQ